MESSSTDKKEHSIYALLNEYPNLTVEILSYLISSTQHLAKLREISKRWNTHVLPYVLRSSGTVKNCSTSQTDSFVKELINFGERSYAGKYCHLHGHNDNFHFLEASNEGDVFVTGMLLVSDYDGYNTINIAHEEGYKVASDKSNQFSGFCETMFACVRDSTSSWEAFQEAAEEARPSGMFLSVEDLEHGASFGCVIAVWDDFLPVVLQVVIPIEGATLLEDRSYGRKVLLKAKVPKDEYSDGMYPFVKFNEKAMASDDDNYVISTFVGYNVESFDNGKFTCQVPMLFPIDEGIEKFLWDADASFSFIPLDNMWRKHQEKNIREGVAIADGMVPLELHTTLMKQVDTFSSEHQIEDYHPNSNNIVRDIVHPALYSYVRDVSPLVRSTSEVPPAVFSVANRPEGSDKQDYWGRQYETSAKYQWLPTYFDIGMDGSCTICDYINNLVPRSMHEDLYTSLAQLFSHALPLLESVYSYCRVVKEHHLRDHEEEMDWSDAPLEAIQEVPLSLRGQRLQVVTKIVDYEVSPGQSYEGVWHVEGMSHEEIVATAIYFIDRDKDITGGNILFKRAFHRQEANYVFSRIDQARPNEVENLIWEGLIPLGQVETKQGRLLVFPNSHVHKVAKLENIGMDSSSKTKQKRRIIVFFLINPEKRIVSTREVPVQQEHAKGHMKRSDALEHRLELMKERKYSKQDWNVREIELCEH